MKKKELIEIIRFAVREELKELLPEVIKECIKTTPSKKQITKTIDPVELTKEVLASKVRKPTKKKKVIRYTSNDALNEALNETVGGVPQEASRVSESVESNQSSHTDLNGNKVEVEDLPEELATALTRDYSDLMGAINKKKGAQA